MKIPEYLKMRADEEDIKDWCIVRYQRETGSCCGPIALTEDSPSFLGFPKGQIGPEVLTFDTKEEAQTFLDGSPGQPPGARDVPELVKDQKLMVRVYSHWNGSSSVVWEGNDLLELRKIYFMLVGRQKLADDNYMKIEIRTADGYRSEIEWVDDYQKKMGNPPRERKEYRLPTW